MLSLYPVHGKRKRAFKFEAYWLEEKECKGVIMDIWAEIEVFLRKFTR